MAHQRSPKIKVHGFISLLATVLAVLVVEVPGQAATTPGPNFGPAALFGSGGYTAQGVVMADVNGDGKLDIIVSSWWNANNENQGLVGVLLGNGDGSFEPVVTYATGGAPNYSVVVADVNGDGKPDIIVASCSPNPGTCGSVDGVVSVLLGNGNGTFQSALTFDAGAAQTAHVFVADLNGDGKPDVIVSNYFGGSSGDGTVAVLLGNGNGTFRSPVLYDSGAQDANGIAAADVNGDGVPDLLVANRCDSCAGGGVVGVLLGNGDGTFRPVTAYPTGGRNSSFVAVADLNGDGKPDLVVANLNIFIPAGSVSVFLGLGDGNFRPAVTYSSGGYAAPEAHISDVNGDGIPDIVVADCGPIDGCGTGVIGVLLGNGNGTFAPVVAFSAGAYNSTSIAVGDVNGDGSPDLVTSNQCAADDCTTGTVSVLLNKTSFCMTAPVITVAATPAALWPPNGKITPVTVSGTITDTGCTIASATYAVTDDYGQLQPSGPVMVGAGGTYSFTVLLQASRLGRDSNGRLYTVGVSATNNAGKTGSQVAVVIVPHDQGH